MLGTELCTHVEPPVAVKVTDPPVSATVTVTFGVVTLVTRSELLEPESLLASNDIPDGAMGAVVSRVIVVVAVAAEAGPVFPAVSVAPFMANWGINVPWLHEVIVTVRVVPESVPGANEHPVAVPVFEKSAGATPVTLSENVKVYVNELAFVGVD